MSQEMPKLKPIIEPPIQIPTSETIHLINDVSRRLGYLEGLVVSVLARDDVQMPEDVRCMLGEALG